MGKVPIYNQDGTLRMDQFIRARDVLALVLPFLTTVAGFWLGSQGTAQAQNQAEAAQNRAKGAQDELTRKSDQMAAVIAYASSKLPEGENVLDGARQAHPEAFV